MGLIEYFPNDTALIYDEYHKRIAYAIQAYDSHWELSLEKNSNSRNRILRALDCHNIYF